MVPDTPIVLLFESMRLRLSRYTGFTLIELSIVLVIIGLIAGGVLVGQDLIRAAGVRAQIAQIEKYNQAVNTFKGKYGYLPGDITPALATQFNFTAGMPRWGNPGMGDGNGLIEGIGWCCAVSYYMMEGEVMNFWEDLSVNSGGLIDGSFTAAPGANLVAQLTGSGFNAYFPQAKIGNGNYIFITAYNGTNYFNLELPQLMAIGGGGLVSGPGLTVAQAYNIDKKIDDGLPQNGTVLAQYDNISLESGCPAWAAGGGVEGAPGGCSAPTTTLTPGTSTTCYDNNNVMGVQNYSMKQNNGAGVNCALSFKFQ